MFNIISFSFNSGIGTVRNGSRSWFGIGSFGIQPSEFTKLAIIIFTSKYLTKNNKIIKNVKRNSTNFIINFIYFGLIMLQLDFTGTVLVRPLLVLFVGGVDFKFFLRIGFVGMIGVAGLIISALIV